ncbi:hypothetical protein CK489_28790 [Bradyrhizobium sp. UFLA03-84]|uniref:hypothetical protein n=1 Tax=Bradyrhizobium sp. UFLA03-84 TaxID=418599 RepID=UPI000BAE0EE3|nr:hypothetical protein [Bradyrhizobium sp. UFLA03-84]PAY05390.1 hypothetical protein CK489_28790 [Bradyrhizobium sp. UFLA03-84]
MVDRPKSRKTHISRIFGTNKQGERLSDMWADVERIDVAKSKNQVSKSNGSQGVQRKLRWRDDPNADDYSPDGNPSRKVEILKLCDPEAEEDVNDPSEWIPLRVIRGLRPRIEGGANANGAAGMDRFRNAVNEELKSSRVVEVRRVIRYETNYDSVIDAAAEANPGLLEYVIPTDDYQKDLTTKDDKGDYIEYEVPLYLKHKGNHDDVSGQSGQTKLLNQYLIDESEAPTGKVVGANGLNPPYRLDPYQYIVNVNFGGLAVEFPDESYIEISQAVPPSKKLFMSIWFRVPAESLAAAKTEFEAWKDSGADRPPLTGIVPIAVFGSSRTAKKFDFPLREVGTVAAVTSYSWDTSICGWQQVGETVPSQPDEASHWVFNDETRDIDPSYIGIDCSGDVPKLSVNIVMPTSNLATIEGSWPVIVSTEAPDAIGLYGTVTATDECTPPVNNHAPGDGSVCDLEHKPSVLPFNDITNTDTYESNADVVMGYRPETFRTVSGSNVGDISFGEHFLEASPGGQEVTPGEWHNLELSIDFTNSCSADGILGDGSVVPDLFDTAGSRTSSACRMFIAFDDRNLTGKSMSAYWPTGYSDTNAILPVNGYFVATDITNSFSATADDCFGNNVTLVQNQQQPKFRYSPAAFAPGLVSFPGSLYAGMNKRIEMGEAQIFMDVTADTASETVRRAFITEKGSPASLKKARDLFGKSPEVLVHGSENWKKARNTGSLADPDNPEDGIAVGKIKRFTPNPKLGR